MDSKVCKFCKQTIKHEIPEHLLYLDWLSELDILINRHSSLGFCADISSMTIGELWHLYQYLSNLES